MTPSKLVDRFGKVLTPALLVLITSIFVFSMFKPIGEFAAPIGDYAHFPLPKGFLVLLGIIFSLACLTTSVGLLTSCSQYFAKLMLKVSYKVWITILSVSSMIFANVGLTQILKISFPSLTAIYPMTIVLIVLTLTNDFYKGNSYVYLFAMICTSFVSILEALEQFGLKVIILNSLPFYSKGLGWIIQQLLAL